MRWRRRAGTRFASTAAGLELSALQRHFAALRDDHALPGELHFHARGALRCENAHRAGVRKANAQIELTTAYRDRRDDNLRRVNHEVRVRVETGMHAAVIERHRDRFPDSSNVKSSGPAMSISPPAASVISAWPELTVMSLPLTSTVVLRPSMTSTLTAPFTAMSSPEMRRDLRLRRLRGGGETAAGAQGQREEEHSQRERMPMRSWVAVLDAIVEATADSPILYADGARG